VKVLLTNDDGYKAESLHVLAQSLLTHGHRVSIFSTSKDASGYGNALTITHKVNMRKRTFKEGYSAYVLEDETTADCVIIGTQFVNKDIDIVIAGINYGPNIGKDINHSATVGGAREALMLGKPGIAVSINSFRPKHLREVANLFVDLLDGVLVQYLTTDYILNINFPDRTPSRIKGIRVAPPSNYGWDNQIAFKTIKNYIQVSIKGIRPNVPGEPGTDWWWLKQGYITVTPLGKSDVDIQLVESLANKLSLSKFW